MAQRLGLTRSQPKDLTISLGSGEASLLELTGSFAVVANGGYQAKPYGLIEVKTRSGKVLYQHPGVTTKRLLDVGIANQMRQLLNAVASYGTARNSRVPGFCAAKTGTTQKHRDAWFIGFTDRYVMGVWVGNDGNASMKKVTGSKLPGQIWKEVMGRM
jgi:penicillin-binding protein 1A